MSLDVILTPIGSAGDVHPFIGLGRELKRRGHRVTVFTNEYFRDTVLRSGLGFDPSFPADDFERTASDPRLWHPTRAFEFLAKNFFLPLTPVFYDYLAKKYVPGRTLVVSSTLSWGARLAEEKLGVPNVTIHLQPSVMISADETAVYAGLDWVGRAPRWLRRLYVGLAEANIDAVAAPGLNRHRAALGLSPVRRIFSQWSHSPRRAIGLFPEWFAAPQPDWPPQMRLTGFPLYDAVDVHGMPPALEKFLDEGAAPVVFTAGSAMKQARPMFETAVEVCRRTGLRGVIVNRFADQVPPNLPPGVVWAEWAPFPLLFPRAAAVQHHGGIGTTAQAMAAGIPQLVTPFAHDQFDNADRARRLGVAEVLRPKKYTAASLERALRKLLTGGDVRRRALHLKPRLDGPAAIAKTCDLILESAA